MQDWTSLPLTKREREVMEIAFRLGEASAQEIMAEMPDPPSYSAVRALLATMVEKGQLKHRKASRRYLYRPVMSNGRARRDALRQVLATVFGGRPEKLVAALLDPEDQKLSEAEIRRIRAVIENDETPGPRP